MIGFYRSIPLIIVESLIRGNKITGTEKEFLRQVLITCDSKVVEEFVDNYNHNRKVN